MKEPMKVNTKDFKDFEQFTFNHTLTQYHEGKPLKFGPKNAVVTFGKMNNRPIQSLKGRKIGDTLSKLKNVTKISDREGVTRSRRPDGTSQPQNPMQINKSYLRVDNFVVLGHKTLKLPFEGNLMEARKECLKLGDKVRIINVFSDAD